jgi:hypothetical protein
MDDDDGSDVTRIMEDVLDTPTRSEWSVKGPSIRRSAQGRWARFVPATALVAAAAVAVALITSVALLAHSGGGARHTSAAGGGTRASGTTPGATVLTPSLNSPAPSVPSSGEPSTVPSGSPSATAPVVTTTSVPAVGPKSQPASCQPTPSPIEVSTGSTMACIRVGAVLSVAFTHAVEFSGVPGGWIGGATSSDPTLVAVDSSAATGATLTAAVRGVAPGTAIVTVSFENGCSAGTTTPCTIPPQGQESITVQVTGQ